MESNEIDMSPEAITNRLKLMEQLWELSVSLMNARPVEVERDDAVIERTVKVTDETNSF